MNLFHEVLVSFLIVAGGVFALVGSFGLIKLPDLMSRLHAPTKATTLGVGGALIASMVYFLALEGKVSIHELMISIFLFLTAPITAHFIAKAYFHLHLDPSRLPPPRGTRGWATFDDGMADDAQGEASEPPKGRARGG